MASKNWLIIFSIYIFLPLSIVVNGDIVDNIRNQTIFQNNTNNFTDVNSNITTPLEILPNKIEESNVSYIYPKKVNKTEEELIGRTERKLFTKDEYGDDILLIFSSPLEIVNNSHNDTEMNNQSENNLINMTLSFQNKNNATYNNDTTTSEKPVIKEFIEADKKNTTSNSSTDVIEDTNKHFLKRLTNFSKLRYKTTNLTRSKPVKKIRISNQAIDKINVTHKANTTASKIEKVKTSLRLKNDSLLKIPYKNKTENIPKIQNVKIENPSTSKNNISSEELVQDSLPIIHTNRLNKLKIASEKNYETTANSNGVFSAEGKMKKIDSFHVDMIPFTLEDAMVPLDQSGSELRNYWIKPDTKKNIENLQDMIRDTIMDVHKNLKQKQLIKNKKVRFTNNGGKKYINYGVEDPKQLSSFKHIQDSGKYYNQQGNFNILSGKSMNKHISLPEQKSPLTESEMLRSVMGAWDYIQEARNKEFMHSLIPIPEIVAPTANNGLLIVGPIPKSLPQKFKSEPFKEQLQLPEA